MVPSAVDDKHRSASCLPLCCHTACPPTLPALCLLLTCCYLIVCALSLLLPSRWAGAGNKYVLAFPMQHAALACCRSPRQGWRTWGKNVEPAEGTFHLSGLRGSAVQATMVGRRHSPAIPRLLCGAFLLSLACLPGYLAPPACAGGAPTISSEHAADNSAGT